MQVVAELDRGDQVAATALRIRPDVGCPRHRPCPGETASPWQPELYERLPQCQALVLTGLSQPGNLLRALKVHVRGLLVKDASAETLAVAIRKVAAGQRVIDPELVAAALETGSSPLTDRETDVLPRRPDWHQHRGNRYPAGSFLSGRA